MTRTFKLHITIKDGKISYEMELDRDSTRCFHQAWQDVDGVLHISNTWERDTSLLERIGRKALGFYRVMVAKVRAI